MTDKNFLVSGTAVTLSIQGLLKLPKRKFYDAAAFNDNQYRHEIANHYRDFKLRRHIKQRKKQASSYYSGKTEAAKDFSLDYQQELPVAVHIFPIFEKVCTPRGHYKCCEQRRPVLIYNDTIRRIQSSKENTELLKNLAKKQVERLRQKNLCKKWSNDIKTANKLNICKFQQNSRRGLAKLENIDYFEWQQKFKSGCGVIRPFHVKAHRLEEGVEQQGICAGKVADETLKYYLQLATDFYQNGFLRNIKYLENLAERNQLRRRRHAQPQQQSIQQQKLKFHTIGYFSHTIGNSLETEHITDASLSSCDRKQNQINQNNPILWHTHKLEVNEFPLNSGKNRNCAIRVNIKPQTLYANNQQENSFNKKIYGKKKTTQESKDFVSMNDYLNGNLKYTQLLQQEQQARTFERSTSANNRNYPANVLLLDNLIYNLKELDIQENRTNLPRITLTDYTDKYPNELEANSQTPAAATRAKERRSNSTLIKQSSLYGCQLDIPLETHFQSEARPP